MISFGSISYVLSSYIHQDLGKTCQLAQRQVINGQNTDGALQKL